MKVSELGLPGAAEQKLARLAMSIEIHCRQRFSTCRTVVEIAAMLIVADTCGIELVRRRRDDFVSALPPKVRPVLEAMASEPACLEILAGRGISYRGRQSVLVEKAQQVPGDQLGYRGRQPLETTPAGVRPVRIYRGRIIED